MIYGFTILKCVFSIFFGTKKVKFQIKCRFWKIAASVDSDSKYLFLSGFDSYVSCVYLLLSID